MECIYYKELDEKSEIIKILSNTNKEQIKHLKALRLKTGEDILLSNGKGLCAFCSLSDYSKSEYIFKVKKLLNNHGELHYSLGLALGILSDKARLEFALEKAVELGVTDFFPLITKYTENKKINLERLNSKAIAAMEQSKRATKINIHPPIEFKNITEFTGGYDNIILADENGEDPENTNNLTSTLCFVGPEGGFSNDEIEIIYNLKKFCSWKLANRRLRAETAVVSLLSFASIKMKLAKK